MELIEILKLITCWITYSLNRWMYFFGIMIPSYSIFLLFFSKKKPLQKENLSWSRFCCLEKIGIKCILIYHSRVSDLMPNKADGMRILSYYILNRSDIYEPLNRTSSRIVRVAAQEFRIVLPAKVKIKNSTSSDYSRL